MNYEEMSDYDIAVQVAKAKGVHWSARPSYPPNNTIHWLYSDNWDAEKSIQLPDYCNNPSGAWPIIVENNISLNHGGSLVDGEWIDIWYAGAGVPSAQSLHTNPLRAAMICFLMLKDSGGGQ